MSSKSPSMQLPLYLVSLAAVSLLVGAVLLSLVQKGQSKNSARQQIARDLSITAEQLSVVVASGSGTANDSNGNTANSTNRSTEWAQSDKLAQLVAAGDVQVKELDDSYSVFNFLSAESDSAVAREVNADWRLLREGLLSFNRSMQTTVQATQSKTQQTPSLPAPVTPTPSFTEVPKSIVALASEFEQIRARVTEGTREQPLIDLVNASSLVWTQIINNEGAGLRALVAEQQAYADELLRLSGVGTENSLYGFYTSDQIVNFVQRVKGIQLPATPVAEESSVKKEPVVREIASPAPVVVSNAFVTEALLQLQSSIAKFLDITTNTRGRLIKWLATAALSTALLSLFAALWQMIRGAKSVRSSDDLETDPPGSNAYKASATEAANSAISNQPMAEPAISGAMSVRDADQLIEDIDAIAGGDLRHLVRVPHHDHGKAIAESVNRTAAVIEKLVGMTRGVASRIDGVVVQHDKLGRSLAEQDIRRQSDTAELSDSISARSALLGKQQLVLTGTNELITEIESRSESAVNGVNQVSTSLARVSAQVEVSNGRLLRLLKTAGDVTESTDKLKVLVEQARLQALNVSLKMPVHSQEQMFELDSDNATDSSERSNATGLFDDIHQLTGKLVQISGDTAALSKMLKSEIEETAKSLKISSDEIKESAQHTHTSSLVGKELSSYCGQLQHSIKDALTNIEMQKSELSQTAKRIVRLDKTGNDTSELTLALTQDVTELQTMASRLLESVAGFKMDGAAMEELIMTDSDTADSETANEIVDKDKAGSKKTDVRTGDTVLGEAPLA